MLLGCSAATLGGCSSNSCKDTDSCGAYEPPDVCDGGAECVDAAGVDAEETGALPDGDAMVEAGRDASSDVSLDRPTDGAGDMASIDGRSDAEDTADAQDIADTGDAADEPGAPDAGTDAGRDGTGAQDADADVGPTCDVTKSPVDEPCVVDDRYGVFVSSGGNDTTGLGTKASPYKSVAKGLAAAQGKNVYVCAATFAEAVTVEGSLDGARLFGGFDCVGWAYAASNRPVMKPASGPGLVIKGLTKGLRIEDIEFDAPATTASGESSVAGWVTGSANVRLVRVKLVAAAAKAGADGVAASNYDPSVQQSDVKIAGHDATDATGGMAQACANLCTNAQHATGGKGGNGGPDAVGDDAGADAGVPTNGADGGPPITPVSPAGATGAGGVSTSLGCSNGVRGSDAPPRAGGNGATQPGTLTATGWTRMDGARGTNGDPGQGGGGGSGGQNASMGGGGGGGCGGCGGAAGPGGQSGGSSFALLSYQSTMTLDGCTLVAAAGGGGGSGADGETGQLGGAGGVQASFGCPGGAGGQGGEGGGGGGGAGGHSVAIGYVGTAPTQSGGTTMSVASQPAAAGAAAAGGSPAATMGAAGKAENVLQLM